MDLFNSVVICFPNGMKILLPEVLFFTNRLKGQYVNGKEFVRITFEAFISEHGSEVFRKALLGVDFISQGEEVYYETNAEFKTVPFESQREIEQFIRYVVYKGYSHGVYSQPEVINKWFKDSSNIDKIYFEETID